MNYRQYYAKLIKDISHLESFNEEQYQKLKEDKEFFDRQEREVYNDLQTELYIVMQKCKKVSELLNGNQVKSTDKVDTDVLGFLPIDISDGILMSGASHFLPVKYLSPARLMDSGC